MELIVTFVLPVIETVFAGFLLYLLQKSNKEKEEMRKQKDDAVKKQEEDEKEWKHHVTQAVIQLLRIQLCEYHDRYMEKGAIPTYAYDNWTRMYEEYHRLGGNGMVTHMNEDIERLNMTNRKGDKDV